MQKLTVTDHDKKPILLIIGSVTVIKDLSTTPFLGTYAPTRPRAVTRHRTRFCDDLPYMAGERKMTGSDSGSES